MIKNKKYIIYLSVLIVVILLCLFLIYSKNILEIFNNNEKQIVNQITSPNDTLNTDNNNNIPNDKSDKLKVEVLRVVDGDTFEIMYDDKKTKVRLIGIDTPESVHSDESKNTNEGRIASDFTKDNLLNKTVELEFDVSKYDKYGRLLAYVYLDGYMFNKKLLEEGMAKLATYPPNIKYVEEFKKIQKQAQKLEKGFWKDYFNKL